jgi:hypothetical protein
MSEGYLRSNSTPSYAERLHAASAHDLWHISLEQCGRVPHTLLRESGASVANVSHGSSAQNNYRLPLFSIATYLYYICFILQGVEENIWTKEGWSDGRVEKAV